MKPVENTMFVQAHIIQQDVMKQHHKVLDVQSHLRCQSAKLQSDIVKLSYDSEINTQGILSFIKKDKALIKHFVVDGFNWFDHQKAILQYFKDAVGDYDVNVVKTSLDKNGFKCESKKQIQLYTTYSMIASFIIATFISQLNDLTFLPTMMIMVVTYTIAIVCTIAVVEGITKH